MILKTSKKLPRKFSTKKSMKQELDIEKGEFYRLAKYCTLFVKDHIPNL